MADKMEPTALATMRETVHMVEGWLVPLTAEQSDRLRQAADALFSVASAIDQENWLRHGTA